MPRLVDDFACEALVGVKRDDEDGDEAGLRAEVAAVATGLLGEFDPCCCCCCCCCPRAARLTDARKAADLVVVQVEGGVV